MTKILVIDRSTDTQSVALVKDGAIVPRVFVGEDSRSGDWPVKVRDFLVSNGVEPAELDQIVVGQGPGSFAGIRAALAFAQGLALGGKAKVYGLPSPVAFTRAEVKLAVVGDARRDRYWVVLYSGVKTERDFYLVTRDELGGAVPDGYVVVTPDGKRIDSLLKEHYGARYVGALTPLAARLAEVAVSNPELLRPEPLPIYLQAAVRT